MTTLHREGTSATRPSSISTCLHRIKRSRQPVQKTSTTRASASSSKCSRQSRQNLCLVRRHSSTAGSLELKTLFGRSLQLISSSAQARTPVSTRPGLSTHVSIRNKRPARCSPSASSNRRGLLSTCRDTRTHKSRLQGE